MDLSTGTAYVKTAPLIQYTCLTKMSEILKITDGINHMIISIAYQHCQIIIKNNFVVVMGRASLAFILRDVTRFTVLSHRLVQ